jgi:uncharacterized protein YcbX
MGEELNAAEITERGLLGDRAYALVDSSDGNVGLHACVGRGGAIRRGDAISLE